MKNKALTYLLVGILSLSLIGCGKKEETESVANVSEEVIQEEVNEPEENFIEDSEQEENIDEEVVEEISGINIKSQIVKDYLGGDYIEETEVINGVKYYVYPNGVVADIVEENYSLFDEGEYNGKEIVLAIYGENQFCTDETHQNLSRDKMYLHTESEKYSEIPEDYKYVGDMTITDVNKNFVIPNTVDLYRIQSTNQTDIETLTVGENVTYFVGEKFITDFENINSIQNRIVYDEIFGRCSNLKEYTIPDGVGILYRTFWECSSLEKVTLPNTICEIGSYSFAGCKNLKEITIPEGTEIIGEGAFAACEGLTEIILPDSITYIGENVFNGCENLTRLEVSSNIDDEIYTCLQNYSSKLPNLEIVKR